MTRKHFRALAQVISDRVRLEPDSIETLRRTAEGIATVCATTNPNFNRLQFLEACGVYDDSILEALDA